MKTRLIIFFAIYFCISVPCLANPPLMLQAMLGASACYELDSTWTPQWGSLVGYWKLNGSGTIANGATVSATIGQNGTSTDPGTANSYVRGGVGQVFSSAGNGISLPSVISTQTANITMMAWFYWTGTTASTAIFYNGNGGANGYGLRISSGCAVGNKVTLLLGGLNCDALNSTYVMPTNKWTHLALTRSVGGTWTLYADGQVVGTGSAGPAVPAGAYTGFGALTGLIDEVAFWNVALTAAEITKIYDQQACGRH